MKISFLFSFIYILTLMGCMKYGTIVSVVDPSQVNLNTVNREGSLNCVLPSGTDHANIDISPPLYNPGSMYGDVSNVLAVRDPVDGLKLICLNCESPAMILMSKDGILAEAEGDASYYKKIAYEGKDVYQYYKYIINSGASSNYYGQTYWWTNFTPVLSTHWNNVKEIQGTIVPKRSTGYTLILVGSLLLACNMLTNGGSGGNYVCIGMDIMSLYWLFWPKESYTVYSSLPVHPMGNWRN